MSRALEAQPAHPLPTALQLQAAAAEFGADLAGDPPALIEQARIHMEAAEQLARAAAEHRYAAGLQLLAAREKYACPLGGNGWLEHLAGIGIDNRRASEFMRIAAWIASAEPAARRKLLGLGKKKQLALCAIVEPETIDLANQSGELDELIATPKQELATRVAKLRQQVVDAQALADGYRTIIDQLKQARVDSIDSTFAALRDQAVFLIERIGYDVATLQTLAAERVVVEDFNSLRDDARDRQAVATVIYHGLNGCMANALKVLDGIKQCFGSYVTGDVQPQFQYSPAEREALKTLRERALSAAGNEYHKALLDSRTKNKVRGRHS